MEDDTFGPRLPGHFNFTLLFLHVFLHIIPSVIIIFSTVFYFVKRSKPKGAALVRPGVLLWVKLAFTVALVGLQIANATLWRSPSPYNSGLSKATAILSCFSALCFTVAVCAGHMFSVQSLSWVSFYLTLTMLFDIVTALSYSARPGLETITRVYIAIPIIRFVLICLEEVSKRSLVRSDALRSSLSHEDVAGFWNKSLFAWVNPILLFGFRGNITPKTMPNLGAEFHSNPLYGKFLPIWEKRNKSSKFALLWVCVYTMPWPFVYIMFPRLLAVGFDFSQPFLLQNVVNEVSSGDQPSTDVMRGLILAAALIFTGKAMSTAWYNYIKNQISIQIRSVLIGAIYHKSLRLSVDSLDGAAALTLMTADVPQVAALVSLSYDSWARVLEMCCGIALLGAVVGAATIFSVIPVVATTVWSTWVARKMIATRKRWSERTQIRVAATSSLLAQIKDIKMLGLGPFVVKRLQGLFGVEVEAWMKTRGWLAQTLAISGIAELMTPVLVVAATIFWTRRSDPVSPSQLFTVLALVILVTNPLYYLIHSLSSWTTGFACLSRIQDYLVLPEPEDLRQFALPDTNEKSDSTGQVTKMSSMEKDSKDISTVSDDFIVKMVNVSVAAAKEGSIFADLSVTIAPGKITMLFGPVGCGKSTFLKLLIGEARPASGTITLATRSIAYCSQVPWIQSDTIQNNILGGRELNPVLYRKVIYACALDVDLDRLPDGDQTLAGSDGGNLSGGQKQRISVARAFYSEAKLIILDDVLSALDAETSKALRSRLLSNRDSTALCGNSTIIMTTSSKAHLASADTCYEMSQDGKLHLSTGHKKDIPDEEAGPLEVAQGKDDKKDDTELPAVTEMVHDTMREALSNARYGDFSLYKHFLKPPGPWRVATWLLVYLGAAIFDRFPPIFVRIWLDYDPQNKLYFIGYALLAATSPVFYFLSPTTFYNLVIVPTSFALHRELLEATAFATFEFLAQEDPGSILNRFSQDMASATQQLPLTITPVVWGVCSVIIDVVVIFSGANYSLPIIPAFFAFIFCVQHFYLRTSRQVRIIELDSTKTLIGHFTETDTGISHIRAFQRQSDFAGRLHGKLDESLKPYHLILAIQQWLGSVMNFTTAGMAVAVVSLALNFRQSTSGTAMGLALLSLISFSDFAGITVKFFVAMENNFGSVARIKAFSRDTPREVDDSDGEAAALPEKWPGSGKVEFHGVSAAYKLDTEKPHTALDSITFTAQPGETVGLVGRTGSGKSSTLLVLLRLLDYTGSIQIDGQELRNMPRDFLRSRLTTITQSGLTLRDTVRFNLDPFGFMPEDAQTDETMAEILKLVGLWDHIEKNGGLGAQISEMKFSVGEKQLFQLARAILHKRSTGSKLVLIDEGTASIDDETEQHMYKLLREEFDDCTKIIISHRPAVLADADIILSLSDGVGTVSRPKQEEAVLVSEASKIEQKE